MPHDPQPNLGYNAPYRKMQKNVVNAYNGQNKKDSGRQSEFRSCVEVEVAVLAPRPNVPYGFCGRKATLNHAHALVDDVGLHVLGCRVDILGANCDGSVYYSLSLICQPDIRGH